MSGTPGLEDIFAVMAAASVGDTTARVAVSDAPRLEDPTTRVAVALNLLLDDLARREREVAQSRDQYRQLFELSPLPTWLFDRATLAFLAVNDAAVQHYGYSREEFLAMNIADIRPEADVQRLREDVQELRPSHGPEPWRHRKKDGTVISVEITSRDFFYQGRHARLVLANDVTAREQALAALRQSEARFARLAESGLIGITIVDLDGRLLEANDAFLAMIQWRREDLARGVHVDEITPPESRGVGEAVLGQLRRNAAVKTFEKQYLRRDGTRVPALVGPVALDARRVISFIVDLSERQRLEQVSRQAFELEVENRRILEASRMKSMFLGNMSHELRTPLNAIIGFTGVLLMRLPGPLTDEQERQLAIEKSSAAHLLCLINDLHDLSKIESGQLTLARERVHVQPILEDVRASLQPLAAAKQLEFRLEAPRQPVHVTADPRSLKQILINLVGNAIKFTQRGSVVVSLAEQNSGAVPEAVVTVADTGIGIAPEDQGRVFAAYEQMGSDAREGTGLGLNLSQNLARLMGGTVGFDSEYGQGSRFWLTLPVAP